jgi:hypothetical protein
MVKQNVQEALKKFQGRSKMATGAQQQTAWAPWTRDFAEMLETHLAELKHQGEPKVWHVKPLDNGRLLYATIY